jgi:hypothetical protein
MERSYFKKPSAGAGCGWLISVILALQEAEIRRITVQGQPWQIVCEILSRKYPTTKKGRQSGLRLECLPN